MVDISRVSLGIATVLMVGACADVQTTKMPVPEPLTKRILTDLERQAEQRRGAPDDQGSGLIKPEDARASRETKRAMIYPGTGTFIGPGSPSRAPVTETEGGDITLNFENTDVREVAKVVLGDILKKNYVIDPNVKGAVSLQTSRPIRSADLLPMFETLLRINGAALIQKEGLYSIIPLKSAAPNALPPRLRDYRGRLKPGYGIEIVPLRYIAAGEMEKILEPFVGKEGFLKVDTRRNLLILGGTALELRSWLETVELFDVNWLQGQSVGIFPLEFADAKTIAGELGQILGEDAKVDGIIRVEPLERLNALLVITQQPRYLKDMQAWIDRLDRAGEREPGIRLYVYSVQNRKAADLEAVINGIFGGEQGAAPPKADEPPKLAPGLKPTTLESTRPTPSTTTTPRAATPNTELNVLQVETPIRGGLSESVAATEGGLRLPEETRLRVVADEQNNALMVLATAAEYKIFEAAMRKLDVMPLQVLIEASIVEITLSGDLRYGVQWFLKGGDFGDNQGEIQIGRADPPGFGGFSYALTDPLIAEGVGRIRALIRAEASEGRVNIIQSPSLMVLDNSTASMRVGDQQPVQTSTSTSTEGTFQTSQVDFKDTGVLLTVTPRVNPGGLVTMELSQEVTDVGDIDAATGQRAFNTRTFQSTVAIQSGQTIVLGGLIRDTSSHNESGMPGLYKIPVLGKLFGQTTSNNRRVELIVLITPKVVRDQRDAQEITDEFRRRLKNLQPPTATPTKTRS